MGVVAWHLCNLWKKKNGKEKKILRIFDREIPAYKKKEQQLPSQILGLIIIIIFKSYK